MDPKAFVDKFLRGDSLCRVIVYLCNNCQGTVTDPITSVLHFMITSPVQVTLTQVGVAPFRDRSTLVFPYRLMTEEQRSLLRSFVENIENEVSGSVASVQIGGGCVLSKPSQENVYLESVDVLLAFCQTVSMSKTHKSRATQRAVCNIVLQRIGSLVHLDRSQMQKITKDFWGKVALEQQDA